MRKIKSSAAPRRDRQPLITNADPAAISSMEATTNADAMGRPLAAMAPAVSVKPANFPITALMNTRQRRTLAMRFNRDGLEVDDDEMEDGMDDDMICQCYRFLLGPLVV
jgi:hypothetical protein